MSHTCAIDHGDEPMSLSKSCLPNVITDDGHVPRVAELADNKTLQLMYGPIRAVPTGSGSELTKSPVFC